LADDREIWVAENQRLQHEVKRLRARVAAFETSRWWRLHPRFALARIANRRSRDETPAPPADASPRIERSTDDVADRFRREVVARGEFTEDWFTVYVPVWNALLRELEGRRARVLELGSFEGLSACFLLWRLPGAQVTCVDTFVGIPGYEAYGIGGPDLERRFDRNVALVDASRVHKRVGVTHRVLRDLLDEGESFDLAYIDASHRALDVLADAALTWQLLVPGGICIFDDYGPIPDRVEPLDHPTLAIDAFRGLVADQLEIVDDQRQLIVRKTA
jgi:Methyltransferase domain